jgi:hypothetical protein
VLREPRPEPVAGVGDVERGKRGLMLVDGEGFFSCGAGEASRVELAVPRLEVLTLPMFTSETEVESSFAPSI